MSSKKTYNRRNFIIAILLLAAANILLGTVLVMKSRRAMKTQIDQRMLDIANTAAYMLNGDELEQLNAGDEALPEYQHGLDILRSFQKNIDLAYIYVINCEEDGSFTFLIDPSDDPGEFGEPVVSTTALQLAAGGQSAVDEEAYEDDWGEFYSAYAPVFDSAGEVACVAAVDFNAEWIDEQTGEQVTAASLLTTLSILIAALFSIWMFRRYRKRIDLLNDDITELENEFNELDKMVKKNAVTKLYLMPESDKKNLLTTLASGEVYGNEDQKDDEFALFNQDLRTLIDNMKHYIEYVHAQTYIDQLTGVGNRLSYKEAIENISKKLEADETGSTKFTVVFFDINGLEKVNSQYGFAVGDELLFAAATIIRNAYGHRKVYRIASDEFIVILEDKTLKDQAEYAANMKTALEAFNADRKEDQPKLHLSKGTAEYDPDHDKNYRGTFVRAKEHSDREKQAYYRKLEKQTQQTGGPSK